MVELGYTVRFEAQSGFCSGEKITGTVPYDNFFKQMIMEENTKDLLWQGVPHRKFYVLAGWPISLFGFLWLLIPGWMALQVMGFGEGIEKPDYMLLLFLLPFFFLGAFWLFTPLSRYLEHPNVNYVVTNTSIIMKGGWLFPSTKRLLISQIRSIEVRHGFLGLMRSLGDVRVSSGETSQNRVCQYSLIGIQNPEQVAAIIEMKSQECNRI